MGKKKTRKKIQEMSNKREMKSSVMEIKINGWRNKNKKKLKKKKKDILPKKLKKRKKKKKVKKD